jgi:glyoxylase-like metal-dependent hydrolase (beta-lactamase superfamily II)
MEPARPEKVRAVAGGERLALGGLSIDVIYTPGHASHHVSYLAGDGTLYAGDVAGVLLGGCPVIRPALAPPELDLEAAEASLATLLAVRPSRMLLTHFGQVPDAAAHLAAVSGRNRRWEAEMIAGLDAGEDATALARRMEALEDRELAQAHVAPGIASRYKLTSDAAMTVGGLTRYLTKFHPERLAGSRDAS